MCSISYRLSVLKRQLITSKFSKDLYPLIEKWSFLFASALVNWIFAKGKKIPTMYQRRMGAIVSVANF